MKKVEVAKSVGFCFGVKRAVEKVYKLLDKGYIVYTFGPIIHNPQIVADLEAKGVKVVHDINMVSNDKNKILVIRSHGVSEEILHAIQKQGISSENATCPFIFSIHKKVKKASQTGNIVFIAGNPKHPEIEGVIGHCTGSYYIFQNEKELSDLFKNHSELPLKEITVVAQTTFSIIEWENCLKILKKVCTKIKIFDTICNATVQRQSEARDLSKKSDVMLIIGGKESSNTAKLRNICGTGCVTYVIESVKELPCEAIRNADIVGVTAGASTPTSIIKEVLDTMSEIQDNTDQSTELGNVSFAEMLEESLQNLNTDEKVRGVVVGMSATEVYVDVGRKQAGFIHLSELTADPNAKIEDLVKIGDEMELLVMRTNDQEGTIMLSKRRIDTIKGWEIIEEAEKNQTVITSLVTEVVKGGLIAIIEGIRVFIPASQATATRGESLNDLLKKEVQFRIIEVNRQRRRAIGSILSVLQETKNKLAEKFWETAEVDKEYIGTVKSLTSYGAFVDLGGIDGMIHISELSWERLKHPSEAVNIGDIVTVYIKSLDRENNKVSLGFKKAEDNPWEVLKRNYPVDSIIDAQIVGMTTFGAFAKIIPGIDGLIHISQISDSRIEKPQDVLKIGDTVKVKIIEIDFDKRRISLSIRALLEAKASDNIADKMAIF